MNHFEVIQKLKESDLSFNGNNEKLNSLLQDYPFFSAGHLLQAIEGRNNRDADALKQKAMLYGGESQWLHFVMHQITHSNSGTIEWIREDEEITNTEEKETLTDSEKLKTEYEPFTDDQDLQDAALDGETVVEAEDEAEKKSDQTENEKKSSSTQINNGNPSGDSKEIKNLLPDEGGFLIEPYHTVDYFASQGIRLKEEKQANDPLSKQVKTFTQWLRSMKKINVEEQATIGKKDEETVIQIADNSNREEEVLTETMAQVLIQQGKKSKAIEVYHKLSLIHPEKSSYFVSLIEHLKEEK
jgi:hypothetical protein